MIDTGQLRLSGDALLWFQQGLMAAATAAYQQAISHFDAVLRLRPDFYEAWYERGLALENIGHYTEAIISFDQALKLRPKPDAASQIWVDRGNALQYGLGDYTGAIACYDRALKLSTNHEMAWFHRGNALLYGLSLPEDALTCYTRTLAINPDNHLAWRNRGNTLVELRRHEEAIASYDRALAISPEDEIAWQARTLAMEKSGLDYKQPTTNPAWYTLGYGDPTFVEAETDGEVTFSSELTVTDEITFLPHGQPLLILEDDWGRREILLERDQYLIGRDPKSDICLHSQFASRHHAVLTRIELGNGRCVYQIVDGDMDGKPSTNGLLINGQKLRIWELKAEDVVVFGPRVQIIYRLAPIR